MTASLLGAYADLDVYLVDMSMVVSRYVGDTSKNLGRVFDGARNKPWLLFFDECESCFSKRSEVVKDAHDRWSNQEISYLLQRIEDHPGIVILAINMKQHVDEAFLRRFQNVVEFPVPSRGERLRLWKNGFSSRCVLEKTIDLEHIANKYEMAGGSIMNVIRIRYASLMALERGGDVVYRQDLLRGIQREFAKEGRSLQ